MELNEYFGDWLKVIQENELYKAVKLASNRYKTQSVMPAYQDIFKAFRLCDYDNCKAVLLFQDPYPQYGISTGVALANKEGTTKLSPSLETFILSLRNLEDDKPLVSDFDITMESVGKQGVLMLNSSLTVQENNPGSHNYIWHDFIAIFLINLSIINPGIVYILFGKQAQSFEEYISTTNNLVIKTQHPAYYARYDKLIPSRVFKMMNDWISIQHNCRINWFNNKEYGRKD